MLTVLDPTRIHTNASLLASVVLGEPGDYFDALDRLQPGRLIDAHRTERPRLVFDVDDEVNAFIARVLKGGELAPVAVERLSPKAELEARSRYAEALDLLVGYHPAMPESVRGLIGTLLFVHVANCAGGSSNDAIGTVWVSPRPDWTAARYAECVCHELAHQALFLEDMLSPIFDLRGEEPLIVSSIRRSKRPYESAFHAAVVAAALIEMYRAIGMRAHAEQFVDGLSESVAGFRQLPQHLSPRGLEVLAELEEIASSMRGDPRSAGVA